MYKQGSILMIFYERERKWIEELEEDEGILA